jgi:hypothetical protein
MADFQMPYMHEADTNALINALGGADTYLEFGMGGSTTLAARMGVPNVISVDSSKEWVDNIAAQIAQLEPTGKVLLLHANIGDTRKWGYPIDKNNIDSWPSYYVKPWATVKAYGLDPDLVLIDGRFRVCCFLYSLINLRSGSTILWDDYTDRPEYRLVEKFLAPMEFHDRMAVFKVSESKDTSAIVSSLFENIYNPR